ncbi:sodium/calcium exchanger 3 [Galendromus occidentalis]|uniref:Sodium/calcium exchanger 3 n=1 Tax=Galendromus occidentalis TaxID=34638 RepID=A0AAJ7WI01_9ACAR|nr:sodium/calcium exchanger 3 [Galendromus occidentalis]
MGDSYHNCSGGLLIPFLNEAGWDPTLRAILYLGGLLYCFIGVAIIADVFMCSIEKITSKTRKITLSAQQRIVKVYQEGSRPDSDSDIEPEVIEVKVWNETVANLTLMALGSSAPEILLSIIEIAGNDFKAGELGPGTIVGSAAFNLLVITAVCIISVPAGEIRTIRMIKVFCITATFSVFAYVWLLVILVLISKDVVEVWEGLLTLLFFFILVLLAYLADKGILFPGRKEESTDPKQIELQSSDDPEKVKVNIPNGTDSHKKKFFSNGRIDRPGLLDFIKDIRKHPGLTDEDCATLAAARLADEQAHSRGWYRVSAIRDFTGGKRTKPSISATLQHKLDQEVRELMAVADVLDKRDDKPEADRNRVSTPEVQDLDKQKGTLLTPLPYFIDKEMSYVEFNASQVAVLEKSKKATVLLRRRGNTESEISVRVETIDGTATAHEDYKPLRQLVKFAPGELIKAVTVEIVDDQQWEPDESFFLRMSVPLSQKMLRLGRKTVMEIVIINDDEPGQFTFLRRGVLVKESVGLASLTVIRQKGCDGVAHVHWRTKNQTAVHGKDFVGGDGKLIFEDGECEKAIEIKIVDDFEAEKDEHFEVELFEPSPGSSLGSHTKCTVTIANDDDFNSIMNRIMMMANVNVDKFRLHNETWCEQFKENMNVNGGDLDNATGSDYVMHGLTFFWKVLFSFVPPPAYAGGWITFVVSLALIGLLTAIVGDLAGIFGCLVGLENTVTAITFVALGTSLPDLFASRTAARQEKYADNAIGNVTGSNSVNVFLGLGLPWFIAALYWWSKGEVFRVESGTLTFSVGIYCAVAVCCISLIFARRFLQPLGKAELGGPRPMALASAGFLLFLWLVYIVLSALKAYKHL